MKENIFSNSKNHESESDDEFLDKNYYNIEYPGQNLSRNESFKKWYSFQSEKIKIENEFRSEINQNIEYNEFLVEEEIVTLANSFLFISLCESCQCYSVHSLAENTIIAKCFKCQKEYCIGCSIENYSSDKNKMCFKGYFKALYLRIKYEKGKEIEFGIMEYIFFFVITIVIMPIYLSLISSSSAINRHPNNPINVKNIEMNECFEIYKIFFPVFYSILNFVYIFSFLPILFFISLIIFFVPFLRNKFMIIYNPIVG